ncbi:MAG TPA: transglutaminase family protein [Polyangiaceae bacterium]
MTSASPALLAPTRFLDSDHPAVVAFAKNAVGDARTDAEKTARLFRAVRERLRYDPYTITFDPKDYVASHVLAQERTYCIPKAVLLAAAARAAGLPAQLGFADVKNHLSSQKLLDTLGSDLFAFHGYAEVWVDGTPYKLTPAFNESLCARFGVPALDFDPAAPADALLQAFDGEGRKYMEYLADRGTFVDLPFEHIMSSFRTLYPGLEGHVRAHDEAFHG